MSTLQIVCVVGARPNFIKVAPLLRALEPYPRLQTTVVHTGQHYDDNLSEIFFEELGIKQPDVYLGVGSGKHGVQTARVVERMEAILEKGPSGGARYERVVVFGDVNSTMAATLAAVKLGIPVAHVEAGLRSFDRTMPEEINRIVTDSVADMLLVSEPAGLENLRREGHPEQTIHYVGNVMIDTLYWQLPRAQSLDTLDRFGLTPGHYGVVTLHRPGNVDARETLVGLVEVLLEMSSELKLVFPVHPRTAATIERAGLASRIAEASGFLQLPPLGYMDFLALTSRSQVIITDSGGLQEESTALGIPCLTMRPNTERPITVDVGTSTLIGSDPVTLRHHLYQVLNGNYKKGRCPDLWDGHAAERIVELLTG